MKFVPFAFCDSVWTLLRELDVYEIGKLRDGCWKNAVITNAHNRRHIRYVSVSISYNNNHSSQENPGFYCYIESGGQMMSFKELKKLNRKVLQVKQVKLRDYPPYEGTEFSLEETKELAKFAASFANLAYFNCTHYVDEDCPLFHEILPLFENASFRRIWISDSSGFMADCQFLKQQLKTGVVKELSFWAFNDESKTRSRPILEEFLLTKQFEEAEVRGKSRFDLDFIENLLAKPLEISRSRLSTGVSGGLESLGSLNQGQQVEPSGDVQIAWRSEDGVEITAKLSDSKTHGPSITIVMKKP